MTDSEYTRKNTLTLLGTLLLAPLASLYAGLSS